MIGKFILGGDSRIREVKVHPVVPLSVVDHFSRRNETQERVIGALLGHVKGDVVEVKSSFPVPHNETEEQVAIDIDYCNTMKQLHQKVHPNEQIVGWYGTGADVNVYSELIHGFFDNQCECPVHLIIDTELNNNDMGIKALISNTMGVPSDMAGTLFTPVKCTISYQEDESIGADLLNMTKDQEDGSINIFNELDQLEVIASDLQNKLERLSVYCSSVAQGQISENAKVGKYLMNAVSSIPKIDGTALNQIFNNNVQDILMVVYLSDLVRTQLKLAERLQQVL
eukprot:Nk52_evm30s2273 gene=Nk52_evmTU30s2273